MVESGAADQMTLDIEGIVVGSVGGKKPVGRTLRIEALLLSFTAQDR